MDVDSEGLGIEDLMASFARLLDEDPAAARKLMLKTGAGA